jgi:uncharacterized protein YdhG (YjbR/CyaY superfamily)
MQRKAATVSEYLAQLSPEERGDIQRVRSVIRKNLPRGFKESVQWCMICYAVPLSRFSDTYNNQALCYAALAAQKNYNSLYLMSIYGTAEDVRRFKAEYKASGKRMDMGKSCVRFKSADDLPLDLIGRTIARTTVDDFVEAYKQLRGATAKAAKPGAKKAKKGTKKR